MFIHMFRLIQHVFEFLDNDIHSSHCHTRPLGPKIREWGNSRVHHGEPHHPNQSKKPKHDQVFQH